MFKRGDTHFLRAAVCWEVWDATPPQTTNSMSLLYWTAIFLIWISNSLKKSFARTEASWSRKSESPRVKHSGSLNQVEIWFFVRPLLKHQLLLNRLQLSLKIQQTFPSFFEKLYFNTSNGQIPVNTDSLQKKLRLTRWNWFPNRSWRNSDEKQRKTDFMKPTIVIGFIIFNQQSDKIEHENQFGSDWRSTSKIRQRES